MNYYKLISSTQVHRVHQLPRRRRLRHLLQPSPRSPQPPQEDPHLHGRRPPRPRSINFGVPLGRDLEFDGLRLDPVAELRRVQMVLGRACDSPGVRGALRQESDFGVLQQGGSR
ncbi:unnamed protein product [Linum tenue]|uniref:Uncharacterized protein n=1 Tax=Linum tenue TaxID=586396 RepID=A0AAV0GZ04_9ROSI|nr:unnamed protein product [Linum tenue]